MSHMTTYTKLRFNPVNPDASHICSEDIAHALSMLTRATGHFPQFYSVGQHCLNCCKEAMERNLPVSISLACLLHDAAESYISDLTRAVKEQIPTYNEIEERLLETIYTKYLGRNLTVDEASAVKEIDDSMLYYELKHFMDEEIKTEPPYFISKPDFSLRPFEDVENEYKKTLSALLSLYFDLSK
ncbi:MAG: phosphohydrolase [Firmicutes bacterium]|nr:phosphohydrolase [Bacillota bacterium]